MLSSSCDPDFGSVTSCSLLELLIQFNSNNFSRSQGAIKLVDIIFFLPITHLIILAVRSGCFCCLCYVCFMCLWSLVYLFIGPTLENGKNLGALHNSNATILSIF